MTFFYPLRNKNAFEIFDKMHKAALQESKAGWRDAEAQDACRYPKTCASLPDQLQARNRHKEL